jgi:hypothetical protein
MLRPVNVKAAFQGAILVLLACESSSSAACQLPPSMVFFHVDVLKPFRGTPPTTLPALSPLHHGRLLHRPAHALHAQLSRGVWHVLIPWADMEEAEATWEPVDEF